MFDLLKDIAAIVGIASVVGETTSRCLDKNKGVVDRVGDGYCYLFSKEEEPKAKEEAKEEKSKAA